MYFIPPSSLLGFSLSWRSSVRFQKQQLQLSQQLCMKTTWASPPASSSQKGGKKLAKAHRCTMSALQVLLKRLLAGKYTNGSERVYDGIKLFQNASVNEIIANV